MVACFYRFLCSDWSVWMIDMVHVIGAKYLKSQKMVICALFWSKKSKKWRISAGLGVVFIGVKYKNRGFVRRGVVKSVC